MRHHGQQWVSCLQDLYLYLVAPLKPSMVFTSLYLSMLALNGGCHIRSRLTLLDCTKCPLSLQTDGFLKDNNNAAQRLIDGMNFMAQSVSELSLGPTKAVTSWLTDQIAPAYWKPNSQILVANSHYTCMLVYLLSTSFLCPKMMKIMVQFDEDLYVKNLLPSVFCRLADNFAWEE